MSTGKWPMLLTMLPLLTACGESAVCSDAGVLKSLQEVYDKDMFGPMQPRIPGVFNIQADTATFVSVDKQRGATRCKVIIRTDYLKTVRPLTDAELAKIKEDRASSNLPLTKDELVAYSVEKLGSSKFYVTLSD